jgi:ribulose-5-phosphate 4-epimerase/fuculose-1-phosphate aldolase
MAATKAKSATKRAIKTSKVGRVSKSTRSGKAAKPKLHKPRVSASLLEDVAIASRVLARHQVLDAFGHVSARSDRNPEHFVMTRSLAPELATPADMMEFDSDSEAVGGDTRKPFVERYIHGEIYRTRPEVMAIVHSHAMSVIPFGITGAALRPVYHMGSFLHSGAPVWDIRDKGGDTDMLVSNRYLGRALADTLGRCACALMRGHGFVAVGNSIAEATFRAIYTDGNARIQLQAESLGGPINFLSDAEGRLTTAGNQNAMERPWNLWKQQAKRKT